MGVSLSTLVGWVAVLGIFGAYSFREWTRSQQLSKTAPQRQRPERHIAPSRKEIKEPKAKRTRNDAPHGAKTAPAAGAVAPPAITYSYSSDDDAASNREFARQLASVKQGTKFTGKTKDEARQKSVKQSRAEKLPTAVDNAIVISAPSSTAGIDADDDRSSAASPILAATVDSNVNDMLEKPAPGPSVLRLTGTEEKKSAKDKKPKSAPEPAETKKQRQNRKKVEQAKAAREEAEVERKTKLEAQRRTARQAEGRAAKDGSAFMVAQVNASNAWKSNGVKSSGTAPVSDSFIPSQPLDTFDSNAVQTDASKSSARSADKGEDWMSSLPSEEEQMEMLRKEEDSWSTVKTKSRKAKAAEANENVHSAPVAKEVPITSTVSSAAPSSKSQSTKTFATHKSSFAALSTEVAAEEEEEWDV